MLTNTSSFHQWITPRRTTSDICQARVKHATTEQVQNGPTQIFNKTLILYEV